MPNWIHCFSFFPFLNNCFLERSFQIKPFLFIPMKNKDIASSKTHVGRHNPFLKTLDMVYYTRFSAYSQLEQLAIGTWQNYRIYIQLYIIDSFFKRLVNSFQKWYLSCKELPVYEFNGFHHSGNFFHLNLAGVRNCL